MELDFEPVLERRIHYYLNYIEGVIYWAEEYCLGVYQRIFRQGLRLKHLGEAPIMMLDEFGSVVDRCQVTIITDKTKCWNWNNL